MPWRKEVNIPRGCLAEVESFWGLDYQLETINLVKALNEQHNFLQCNETAEMFCKKFDYGMVAEHYRALFYKKPIWWKKHSCFLAGKRVGLPDCLKPFLCLLCFKLTKTNEQNVCDLQPVVHDCKKDS